MSLIQQLNDRQHEFLSLIEDISTLYHCYPLTQKNGKQRWIEAPIHPLKTIQHELLHTLFYQFPVHTCAHGFVPYRSIITHAQNHVQQKWVFTLDLQDFFPSTHRGLVESCLFPLLTPRFTPQQQQMIIDLCLLKNRLPQGAATSPYLSNLVFKSFDHTLSQWAQQYHLNYSRYADDLSFSGSYVPQDFYKQISKLVQPYKINAKKTRVYSRGTRQQVTGLVVNERVNLPRSQRRVLRAIAHQLQTKGLTSVLQNNVWTQDELSGHIAWLAQVDPHAYQKLFQSLTNLYKKTC